MAATSYRTRPSFAFRSRNLLYTIAAYVFLAVVVSYVGAMLYMLLDKQPPIQNVVGKFVSYNPTNRKVIIEWEWDRNRYCPGAYARWLINGSFHDLGFSEFPQRTGVYGHQIVRTEFVVPEDLTGIIRYEMRLEYYCNLMQKIWRPLVVEPPAIVIQLPSEATAPDVPAPPVPSRPKR